jgi:hypothetical protein
LKKFILLYGGEGVVQPEMKDAEQNTASDTVRRSWIDKNRDVIVDIGQSMVGGRAIVDDGSETKASDLNGYSIIEAASMDEALILVDGNPFLMDKTGMFRIEVFELSK